MRFSKYLLALLLTQNVAQAQVQKHVNEIAKGSDQQKAYVESLKKSGILEHFSEDRVETQVAPYKEVAKQVADSSIGDLAVSLNTYVGLPMDQAQAFTGQNTQTKQQETLTAIFVSFSLSPAEIKDAFKEAQDQGAELFFYGMHPNDKSISDTMRRVREIMADSKIVANARFHPKAFDEFKVTSVPAILYAEKGSVGIAHGSLNITYLKSQMEKTTGFNDFGLLGPTKSVIEKNLLDEIQERFSKIDGESLKKKAIDNFWKKREFVSLPRATKDDEYFINPTVKVTQDIKNPNGEYLARAGDVINPLSTIASQNIYVLFNATDNQQLEWAHNYIKTVDATGIVMLMTSELDQNNGWDHLSALRKHFSMEIYLVPKELVDRFKVTGLPAVVTTDLQRKLLHIKQYSIKD